MELGGGLVDVGLGGGAGIDGALTVVVTLGLGLIGLGLCQLGLRLFGAWPALWMRVISRSTWALESSAWARESAALGLVAGGDVVAGVDFQQQLALMDDRIVVDVELGDVAGNFGAKATALPSV